MRGLVLLLLAGAAWAFGDGDLFVVRIATEHPAFGGPARQTVEAVAVPVNDEGLLMAVGFAVSPPEEEEKEAVKVTAFFPDGTEVPAEVVASDDELECTFFRLHGDRKPEPVALQGARLAVGDEVTLLGRYGGLMDHAARRQRGFVEAIARTPQTLYALREQDPRTIGCVALTPEGKLVGFVDTRPAVGGEGTGVMLGLGAQTIVVVAAETYAESARTLPRKDSQRAWIGVNLAPFDADREAFFGVAENLPGALVTGVAEGSPAAKAGLEVFDLLQSIGPLPIHFEKMEEWAPMLRAVQRLPLGKPLPCRVIRFARQEDGGFAAQLLELTLTLEARPLDFADAPETEFKDLGFKVKPLTDDWRRTRTLPAGMDGVVVTRIAQASPARLAELQPDDLILRVDDKPVADVASLKARIDEARSARRAKVVFFIRRGRETLFLALQPGW